MSLELSESLKHGEVFNNYVNAVWKEIEQAGIKLDGCFPDHVGVRIMWGKKGQGDYSRYIEAKSILKSLGAVMLSESIIPMNSTGRPIAIFKLPAALNTNGGDVQYIEIPAPRYGKDLSKDHIDHIEIVLPKGTSLEDFIFENMPILLRNGVTEDAVMKAIADEQFGVSNTCIVLDFGNDLRVKFHTKDIGSVIRDEQSTMPILDKLAADFKASYPEVMD